MRRYRFGRLAMAATVIYLAAVAAATAAHVAIGQTWWLSAVTMWFNGDDLTDDRTGIDWDVAGLLLSGALKAWLLWHLLRGPAVPSGGPDGGRGAGRDVVWLRRLLYLGVAGDLFAWIVIGALNSVAGAAGVLVLTVATTVMFLRVLGRLWTVFGVLTLGFGLMNGSAPLLLELTGVATSESFLQVITLAGLTVYAWLAMLVIGQRRDARWSDATVRTGGVTLALIPVSLLSGALTSIGYGELASHLAEAMSVLFIVWRVRSAHDLAGTGPQETAEPKRRQGPRTAAGSAAS
ncbi:hypothetical protein GCM10022419_042850 [Nonomuraea rosea]|uniref:DUF998 domain-containing protein n=1 Tax=Nonomuraea rosea TaxID=638574 RepID=A0ABP6X1Y2_9ACTN